MEKNIVMELIYRLPEIAALIVLIVKLVQYVKQSIMLKNWPDLLGLLHEYIAQAEQKFDNGADRKQWVMSMIQATANRVNYPLDMNLIGALIDDLCKLTKEVNVGVKAADNGHN